MTSNQTSSVLYQNGKYNAIVEVSSTKEILSAARFDYLTGRYEGTLPTLNGYSRVSRIFPLSLVSCFKGTGTDIYFRGVSYFVDSIKIDQLAPHFADLMASTGSTEKVVGKTTFYHFFKEGPGEVPCEQFIYPYQPSKNVLEGISTILNKIKSSTL